MREYAQNRIREVRKLRKMSMEALGAAINPSVTHNTIAKLERREMGLTLDYLLEIARVLRVHPSEILPAVGWEESPLNSNIVFVLNGPNLNLLGTREPEIYGSQTLADIEAMLVEQAAPLSLAIDLRQTNHEGTLVDWLHEAQVAGAKAVLLNAGAYTHTSIALHDAIKSIKTPVIEVHLSDPHKREAFRHISYVGMAAVACFAGHGARSYTLALDAAAAL